MGYPMVLVLTGVMESLPEPQVLILEQCRCDAWLWFSPEACIGIQAGSARACTGGSGGQIAPLHPRASTVPVCQLALCFQPDCCSSLYFFTQVGEPAVHIQGQEPLTASMLAAAPPQEQKQMIGGCPGCLRSSCLGVHGQVDLCMLRKA